MPRLLWKSILWWTDSDELLMPDQLKAHWFDAQSELVWRRGANDSGRYQTGA